MKPVSKEYTVRNVYKKHTREEWMNIRKQITLVLMKEAVRQYEEGIIPPWDGAEELREAMHLYESGELVFEFKDDGAEECQP